MHKLLVIEDEAPVRESLVRGLESAGFSVMNTGDGARGLSLWREFSPALVVLDLGLPSRDGWSILEARRALPPSQVIVLTAHSDVNTRLRAFQAGAVDYVAKPFFLEELIARVRARLGAREPTQELVFGVARLDRGGRALSVDGRPVALTPAEFAILAYLAARPGRAISRSALVEALPEGGDRSERTVDSHVSRLRQKLGPAAAHLHTVWGIGWKLEPEPPR